MRTPSLLIILFLCCYSLIAQKIDQASAVSDFEEFVHLLDTHSSYYQLSEYDFESRFDKVTQWINAHDSVAVHELAYKMEQIISETVDRHASIKMEDFEEDDYDSFGLHFPFALAPLGDKVVGLIGDRKTKSYSYFLESYPYVKTSMVYPQMNLSIAMLTVEGLLPRSHNSMMELKT